MNYEETSIIEYRNMLFVPGEHCLSDIVLCQLPEWGSAPIKKEASIILRIKQSREINWRIKCSFNLTANDYLIEVSKAECRIINP